MGILEREKNDRPNNEGMIRGIEKWKYPSNYIGCDYEGYYIIHSMHRDSDHLTISNHEVIIKEIEKISPIVYDYDMKDELHPPVISIRSSHWLVGWIETIMIYKDASIELIKVVNNLMDALSDYPVLDDDDFYQKEEEIIQESYESYIKDEFMGIIKNHFNLYDIEEKEGVMSKWYLDELMDLYNTEYIIENNSAYVYNIEGIKDFLDVEKVKKYFNIEFFED